MNWISHTIIHVVMILSDGTTNQAMQAEEYPPMPVTTSMTMDRAEKCHDLRRVGAAVQGSCGSLWIHRHA